MCAKSSNGNVAQFCGDSAKMAGAWSGAGTGDRAEAEARDKCDIMKSKVVAATGRKEF